ncbi:MAG: hypothetical protein JW764_10300 [Chlorobiaceae bacterium]|nr:hypothetical protein [Chlorobiaceae bacterium]
MTFNSFLFRTLSGFPSFRRQQSIILPAILFPSVVGSVNRFPVLLSGNGIATVFCACRNRFNEKVSGAETAGLS